MLRQDGKTAIWGYTRGSTKKQELTCEVQEDLIRQRAAELEAEGTCVFSYCFKDPATSGKKVLFNARQGGKLLMVAIKPGDHVIFWKLDRIGRKLLDIVTTLEYFVKMNVSVHVLDHGKLALDLTSAVGKMIVTFLAGFTEYEATLISERTKEALDFRRVNGMKVSPGPPPGCRLERQVVEIKGQKVLKMVPVRDEKETAMIHEIDSRLKAGEPIWSILKDFKARKLRRWNGMPWRWDAMKQLSETYQAIVDNGGAI